MNADFSLTGFGFRFPNTLEPWTPRMYACLRDSSPIVRSNTVTVLTHLILNDMIKVKGQISDMALCIMDDQEKISNMAKLFFTELSRKGNALYNVMPDIVSRLSDPAANIDEEKFKEIMRYIIGLIDKDKHLESLVEKLCHRFNATTTDRQWRDLAFCLSLFSFNEKAAKKLVENFDKFSDKLHDDFVHEAIQSIMNQCRKLPKQETKMSIEELSTKVEEARAKCVEDHGAGVRAKSAKNDTGKPSNKNTKKGTKTPARKSKKDETSDESDDDDDEQDEEEKAEEEKGEKSDKPTRKSGRMTKPNKKVIESSDEDEEDDESQEDEEEGTEDDAEDQEEIENKDSNKRQASKSPVVKKDTKRKKNVIEESSEDDSAANEEVKTRTSSKRQASKSPQVNGKGRAKKKSNSSSDQSPKKPSSTRYVRTTVLYLLMHLGRMKN